MYSRLVEGCIEDQTDDKHHHTINRNVYAFLVFHNTFAMSIFHLLLMIHMCVIIRLGFYNTSRAYSDGHVFQPTLKICHVLLHLARSRGIRKLSHI